MYKSTLIFGLAAIAATPVNALATPGFSLKRHAINTEGDCSPQPLGSGPSVSPDTDSAFVSDPTLAKIATQATTPAGWAVVYQDLQAASTDSGYIGNEEITSYDPGYCASQCCSFWPGCESFNIYFERDPVVDPGANCSNPGSTTRIKCSYWSVDLTQGDATNEGQYCADFHIVIAGSNAYKGGCPKPSTTSSAISTTSSVVSTTSSVAPTTTSKPSTLTTTTKATTTSCTTTKAAATTAPPPPPPGPPAPPAPPAPPKPAPPAPAPPAPAPPAPPAPALPKPAPPKPAPPAPAPPGPAPPAPPKPAPPAPAPPAPAPAGGWSNWSRE